MSNQQYELNEISLSYKPKWFMVQKTGITSSRNVFDILVKLFSEDTIAVAEQCVVLFLNHGGKILGSYQLSSGGMTGTIMDVRLILSIALKSLASGIILSHNHPSGS